MTDSIAFSGFWNPGGSPGPIPLQRAPNQNYAVAWVTGTYAGTAPNNIDIQVIPNGGGAAIQPWAGLEEFSVQGNAWSGWITIPQNLSLMQLEARIDDETSVTTTSGPVSCGMNIVIAGQSNGEMFCNLMSGGSPITLNAGGSIFIPTAEFSALTNYSSSSPGYSPPYPYTYCTPLGDGIISLINQVAPGAGCAVNVFIANRTGTSLSRDSAGAEVANAPSQYLRSREGNPFNWPAEGFWPATVTGLRMWSAGLRGGVDFERIVFIGNESDAAGGTPQKKLVADLQGYAADLRGLTGRSPDECPMIVSIVGKQGAATRNLALTAQAAHQACGAPGMIVGADRYDYPTLTSNVHLTASECASLGKRLGQDILCSMGLASIPGAGPYIDAWSINAGIVTARINLNGHSAVTAQNGSIPLTGFQLSTVGADFGSTLAISNAVLNTSANPPTITITPSSPPSGPVLGEYNATSYPPSPADNLIYSTDLIPNDSIGAPLQLTSRSMLCVPV